MLLRIMMLNFITSFITVVPEKLIDFVAHLETKEKAFSFAKKIARKNNCYVSVRKIGEKWCIYPYKPEEWQGWHWSQLTDRKDHFLVTESGKILAPKEVPIVFEDGNNPGMCYLGTIEDMLKLNEDGGHAMSVDVIRIVDNKVFCTGVKYPDDPYDWEMVEIKKW